MASRETKVTVAFVGLGVLAWLATDAVAGGHWPWIALVVVGVLLPALINGQSGDPEEQGAEGDAASGDEGPPDDR